jgi:hypothetical protein
MHNFGNYQQFSKKWDSNKGLLLTLFSQVMLVVSCLILLNLYILFIITYFIRRIWMKSSLKTFLQIA